jgi:hypothetical protein
MVARRHHYVPQYYLKGFSVPRKGKPQVSVFDREERKSFQTATANVAAEKDFNRVEIAGQSPDVFENAMAQFEGEAAPALGLAPDIRDMSSNLLRGSRKECAL